MRIFWHFFLSNLKYNKIELAISYIISLLVFFAFHFFKDPKKPEGDLLFSVAFYALLYAFYSNKRKFNLKYLLSLPLSKTQLLMTKVTSDLIYFLPAISLAFGGALNSEIPFDVIPLMIILLEVILFVSFIMFDSDMEQPRLENARSSFLNRLIYLRKMTDFFFLSVLVVYVAVAVNMSPLSMSIKQYFLILLLAVVLFFKFNRSLKLMKDESLSYFMPKRDLFRIGWKVGFFAVPAATLYVMGFSLPSRYGRESVFNYIQKGQIEKLKNELKVTPKALMGKSGLNLVEAAIDSGNVRVLNTLLENGFHVDWSRTVNTDLYEGASPIHLAVNSGSLEMVKKIIAMNPKSIEFKTKDFETTPLQMSSVLCLPEITEFLLKNNARINLQNANGNTALILAAANNCSVGTMVLMEYGADPKIRNKEGKLVLNYMKTKDKYLISRKMEKEQYRELAGTIEKEASLKLQKLTLPPRQK